MRINKNTQLALLLTFYLCRSGRTTLESSAEGLSVSLSFLQQVARKLRLAGVIRSIKGPGGGYELLGNPKISAVVGVFNQPGVLSNKDRANSRYRGLEHRTLLALDGAITKALGLVLTYTVKEVVSELVASENIQFNRPSPSSSSN